MSTAWAQVEAYAHSPDDAVNEIHRTLRRWNDWTLDENIYIEESRLPPREGYDDRGGRWGYKATASIWKQCTPPTEDGERCRDCRRTYVDLVWWASDDLWEQLTEWGGAGLLCPACFSKRAQKEGLLLRWRPEIMT